MKNKNGHVVIIGGGIYGRAAAAEFAPDFDVTLIEQFGPTHLRGSSHGQDRVTRPAPNEGVIYGKMQKIATQRYMELAKATGLEIVRNANGFHAADMVGRPNPLNWLKATSELCDLHGAAYEVMKASEWNAQSEYFRLREDALVIMQPGLRQIAAANAMEGFRAQAQQQGAQIRFHTTVTDIDYHHKQVHTDNGDVLMADKIIIAAGSWNPLLLKDYRLPVAIEQHNVYYFPISGKSTTLPPAFAYEKTDGVYYGMPSGYDGAPFGSCMKLGNHLHSSDILRPGEDCSPADDFGKNLLTSFVENHMRNVTPTVVHVDTCKYTMTRDSHFLFGEHPVHPDIFVVSACSGHGFKYAPAVAMALRELIDGTECGFRTDFFSLGEQGALLRRSAPLPT